MNRLKRLFQHPLFNLTIIIGLTALLFHVFISANLQEVLTHLSQLNDRWLVLIIALVLVYFSMGGLILFIYSRFFTNQLSLFTCIQISIIGSLGNAISPLGMGSTVFQYYVFNKQKVEPGRSVAILWLDFFLYQIGLTIFTAICLIFFHGYLPKTSWLIGLLVLGFMVNSAVCVLLLLLSSSRRIHHFVTKKVVYALAKLRLVKNPSALNETINQQLQMFRHNIGLFKNRMGTLAMGIGFALCRLVILFSLMYLIGTALALPSLNYFEITSLTAFSFNMNSLIPIPGQVGGAEFLLNKMVSKFFGKYALTVLLLYRFFSYYIILLLGAIMLLWIKFQPSRREHN